jgi:hypothetical protein
LKPNDSGHSGAVAFVATILLSLQVAVAAPQPANFETVLGPTPITDATKSTVTGQGAATATLDGTTLTVKGIFVGLTTPATDAHLMVGSGIGIPGSPVLDLTLAKGTSGTIAGSFKLSSTQLAALRTGRLYIQINSEKAPAPGGNLWGWLLPEHEKAGEAEPLLGPWFLPQGDGLKAAPPRTNGRSSRTTRNEAAAPVPEVRS